MKLYYSAINNFGDDLNPWLWSKLIPEVFDNDESTLFLGIGTGLNHRIPKLPFKVVFGSGVGYGRVPLLDERWKIYFVRGPLSTQVLGLENKFAITDAAMLIRKLNFSYPSEPNLISFIPHILTSKLSSRNINLNFLCSKIDINYIDPSWDIDQVLHNIVNSRLVITEAMHGAIIADAMRVPWIPIQLYDHILEFKWNDWCRSLGIDYNPSVFSARLSSKNVGSFINFIRSLVKNAQPNLSSDHTIEVITARLQEKLEEIKADYRIGFHWGLSNQDSIYSLPVSDFANPHHPNRQIQISEFYQTPTVVNRLSPERRAFLAMRLKNKRRANNE